MLLRLVKRELGLSSIYGLAALEEQFVTLPPMVEVTPGFTVHIISWNYVFDTTSTRYTIMTCPASLTTSEQNPGIRQYREASLHSTALTQYLQDLITKFQMLILHQFA